MLKLSNLLRPLTIGLEDVARVLALPLRARNLVARRILIALQPLELGNQPAPPVLERRKLFELGIGVHAAILQPAFDVFLVIAHISRVKHGGNCMPALPPTAYHLPPSRMTA